MKKNQSKCIWFTGISGSGKSTLAYALHAELTQQGINAYVLDGDVLRTGINADLGFSPEDRTENVRRVGEIAKLMVNANITVLAALISPYRKDRDQVRQLFDEGQFIEVFVDAPLLTCIQRDVKGLYAKAHKGEVALMTAVASPYEEPEKSEIHLRTSKLSIKHCLNEIKEFIRH